MLKLEGKALFNEFFMLQRVLWRRISTLEVLKNLLPSTFFSQKLLTLELGGQGVLLRTLPFGLPGSHVHVRAHKSRLKKNPVKKKGGGETFKRDFSRVQVERLGGAGRAWSHGPERGAQHRQPCGQEGSRRWRPALPRRWSRPLRLRHHRRPPPVCLRHLRRGSWRWRYRPCCRSRHWCSSWSALLSPCVCMCESSVALVY